MLWGPTPARSPNSQSKIVPSEQSWLDCLRLPQKPRPRVLEERGLPHSTSLLNGWGEGDGGTSMGDSEQVWQD